MASTDDRHGPPGSVPTSGKGWSRAGRVLLALWAIFLFVASPVAGLLAVFGLTPTSCTGVDSFACEGGLLAVMVPLTIVGLWLTALVCAIAAVFVRRPGRPLVISLVCPVAAFAVLAWAASTWS